MIHLRIEVGDKVRYYVDGVEVSGKGFCHPRYFVGGKQVTEQEYKQSWSVIEYFKTVWRGLNTILFHPRAYREEAQVFYYAGVKLGRISTPNKEWLAWLIENGYCRRDGFLNKLLDDVAYQKLKELRSAPN